ncbi:uncharacterized protein [Dermacentor albipictus]|uniref:uncharacterized protein n=1 Tax=Dermacentor albipictus TaxID=60249 RepID=UPI0031FCC259
MDSKHDDYCLPAKGEAEGIRVDVPPLAGAQVAIVECPETGSLTAQKDLRLQDCGFSGTPLGVSALAKDVPSPRGRQTETVDASKPMPNCHSLVEPVARHSVPPTVGYKSLSRQVSPARRDQPKTVSMSKPSNSTLRPRSRSLPRVPSMSECQDTPLLVTEFSDPFGDVAWPASPQSDARQSQLAEVTPSPAIRNTQCGSTETFSAAAELRNESQSVIQQLDELAVPVLESRGTLVPRSLGPRRETPRPPFDETPEATADASSAERSDSVLTAGSVAADRAPGQDDARHTSLLAEAYAEDPYAAARVPWATLAVIWMQVLAHWNFLHRHHPERCASVNTILLAGQWGRVAYAAFHHADVDQLSFGALFFFFKGLLLEAALGPAHFVALLAVVVVLVGLVNTSYLFVVCHLTDEPSVCATCMHTFAGVVVALDMVIRSYLDDSTVYYGDRQFGMRPFLYSLFELVLLSFCSEKNSIPIMSGYLVGIFLCDTRLGGLIVRIPNPRRQIYLCVVPNAPVTYLFVVALVFAFLCGPYPDTWAAAESTLTFRYPVWKPPLLSALYLENVYQVTYVGLSLLAVGTDLERDLGHFSFLCLASGLLSAGHHLPRGLSWIACKYAVASGEGVVPAPAPYLSVPSSGCTLIGTLLALKTVHYRKHRDGRGYQMASFDIPVPFWTGALLELAHLRLFIAGSSTAAHVSGILAGLAVAHCGDGCGLLSRVWNASRRPSTRSVVSDEEDRPTSPFGLWCQLCDARTASPTAYWVPETDSYRDTEVLAEDDTALEDEM